MMGFDSPIATINTDFQCLFNIYLSASYAVAEYVDAINEVEIVPKESPYEQKVRIMLAGF